MTSIKQGEIYMEGANGIPVYLEGGLIEHHPRGVQPYLIGILNTYFEVLSYIASDQNSHEVSRQIANLVFEELQSTDKRILFGIGLEKVCEIEVTSKLRADQGCDVMVVLPCQSELMYEKYPSSYAGIVAQSLYMIAGYLGYSLLMQMDGYEINETINGFEADFLRAYYFAHPACSKPRHHIQLFSDFPAI